MTERFTVEAFVAVDVPMTNGRRFRLAEGLNENVPEAVATSWHAKAAGCRIVPPSFAKKEGDADAPARRQRHPERPRLR